MAFTEAVDLAARFLNIYVHSVLSRNVERKKSSKSIAVTNYRHQGRGDEAAWGDRCQRDGLWESHKRVRCHKRSHELEHAGG